MSSGRPFFFGLPDYSPKNSRVLRPLLGRRAAAGYFGLYTSQSDTLIRWPLSPHFSR
jgi:hypothetical protein